MKYSSYINYVYVVINYYLKYLFIESLLRHEKRRSRQEISFDSIASHPNARRK